MAHQPERPYTKAEFARLAGVTKPAISKALKGPLKAALHGELVDIDHPAAAAYLAARGKKPPPARAPTRTSKSSSAAPSPPTEPLEIDESDAAAPPAPRRRRALPAPRLNSEEGLEQLAEREEYAHLSISEIARRWGTFRGFVVLLDALKTIAETARIDLANAEKRGSVISRDLVRTHVFGLVEATNKRLLVDLPRTITGRLYAMAKSGAPPELAEQTVRELISSQLKIVKTTAVRVLRGGPAPSDNDSGSAAA